MIQCTVYTYSVYSLYSEVCLCLFSCGLCGYETDHWLAVSGDVVYISHRDTCVSRLHSVTCSDSNNIVNVCNNTLFHAFKFLGCYINIYIYNLFVSHINIHNKNLLFKSFCRVINLPVPLSCLWVVWMAVIRSGRVLQLQIVMVFCLQFSCFIAGISPQ